MANETGAHDASTGLPVVWVSIQSFHKVQLPKEILSKIISYALFDEGRTPNQKQWALGSGRASAGRLNAGKLKFRGRIGRTSITFSPRLFPVKEPKGPWRVTSASCTDEKWKHYNFFPLIFFHGLAHVFYTPFLIPSTISGQDDMLLDLMINSPVNVSTHQQIGGNCSGHSGCFVEWPELWKWPEWWPLSRQGKMAWEWIIWRVGCLALSAARAAALYFCSSQLSHLHWIKIVLKILFL